MRVIEISNSEYRASDVRVRQTAIGDYLWCCFAATFGKYQ